MDNNSFFSVDRLVEFGLGMAMAQQMVGMMNQTMQTMQMPGELQQPISQRTFYVAQDGNAVGPLSPKELTQLVMNHTVNKDTLAWMPGMPAWKPIEQIPEILKVIALTPPPLNI
jgi:hypothetical protein